MVRPTVVKIPVAELLAEAGLAPGTAFTFDPPADMEILGLTVSLQNGDVRLEGTLEAVASAIARMETEGYWIHPTT